MLNKQLIADRVANYDPSKMPDCHKDHYVFVDGQYARMFGPVMDSLNFYPGQEITMSEFKKSTHVTMWYLIGKVNRDSILPFHVIDSLDSDLSRLN